MDRSGMIKLLQSVCVNYPQFRKHIEGPNGGISETVITEWSRHIGYLDYDEALDRLDQHMGGENGNRIPKPIDLKKFRTQNRTVEWHAPDPHKWHLEFQKWDTRRMHGRLYDQEDREYVHDPQYEDGYHYDQQGHICDHAGKVVFW